MGSLTGGSARDEQVVRVERVVAGGEGLARPAGGPVTLVAGALPGEVVRIRVRERRRDVHRGEILEVIEASAWRRDPPCPHVAEGCGGCTWQHVDPAGQAELKRRIVVDALRRIAKLERPLVESSVPLPATGYRTTLRPHVAHGRWGFLGRGSRQHVPVERCLVAHPLLDELLRVVRTSGTGEVLLRCGARTGERAVVPARGVLVLDRPTGCTGGVVHEVVAGHRFRISPGSFFQARPDGAEVLVDLVRAAMPAGARRVVDAYAGVGLFAATAAPHARVVAVEQGRAAVADARENLAGLDATVVRAEVAVWRPEPADVVIADPARPGLGRTASETLAATGAPRLVLVSCDPASLARDTSLLAAHGFALDRTTVVDLFPQTPHVETVSVFSRSSGGPVGSEQRA